MGKAAILALAGCAAAWAIGAPLATTAYVDRKASDALTAAKAYTDQYTPDMSAYATTNQLNFRVDSATNVVWRCVWSNGVEYIYAHSNTVRRAGQ